MVDRLKTLKRIEAVQGEMLKLTEWKLASAERACRDLAANAGHLRAFIGAPDDNETGESCDRKPLGLTLARAAHKSLVTLDRRLAAAELDRTAQRTKLDALRRRDHAVRAATRRAETKARRDEEARDLTLLMEAWLAAKHS